MELAARPQGAVSPLATLVVLCLRAYRVVVSPLVGPACRFEPSCSRYAEEAILRHGLFAGARMAIGRVLRCHPWNAGGYDPVR